MYWRVLRNPVLMFTAKKKKIKPRTIFLRSCLPQQKNTRHAIFWYLRLQRKNNYSHLQQKKNWWPATSDFVPALGTPETAGVMQPLCHMWAPNAAGVM